MEKIVIKEGINKVTKLPNNSTPISTLKESEKRFNSIRTERKFGSSSLRRTRNPRKTRFNNRRKSFTRKTIKKQILSINVSSKTRKGGREKTKKLFLAVGDPSKNTIGLGRAIHNLKKKVSIGELMDAAGTVALKNQQKIYVHKGTVSHNFIGKSKGVKVAILRSRSGVIEANETIRKICEVVGITSLKVKMWKVNCKYTQAYAFINALMKIESVAEISYRRGKSPKYILQTTLTKELVKQRRKIYMENNNKEIGGMN